ncbi:MAG: PDZ domain-containing protein [Armatimonadota bacterium]|nr:PDZ domain-containing protein [Armatimonadota bacterium]
MVISSLRLMVIGIMVAVVCGCEPVMRELQYTNPRTRLFPMHMDLGIGDEKVDAATIIASQNYVAFVEYPNVIVHYPNGMSALAKQVADAFEKARIKIAERTGIIWAFKPIIYLVPVTNTSCGYRLRIPLRKQRELKLPLLILPNGVVLPEWSSGIAHELTEASMLASLSRRELFLGDYCIFGGGLVNETRWFRDGVSELAGEILNRELFGEEYQPPTDIYAELSRIRELLLDWNNCEEYTANERAYYLASLGLIHELTNRYGDYVIAQIVEAASKHRYINGSTLLRAVNKITGTDLKEFLRTYQPTWLGIETVDAGQKVKIAAVYSGGPAEKWGLKAGDIITSVDGQHVPSSAWLVHYIAARRPRERISVEVERAGVSSKYRLMVVSKPAFH